MPLDGPWVSADAETPVSVTKAALDDEKAFSRGIWEGIAPEELEPTKTACPPVPRWHLVRASL